MLIGFNNDVEYRDKKFHIQTEDHGTGTAKIESQIFHEGQILDTEIIDYDSLLEENDEEEAEPKIKSLMQQTHKGLYERLVSGEYDERVGLEPLEEDEIEAPNPDEFEPGQDRVPTAAQEIEEKGEEAVREFHESQAQRHTNLDNLKDHLEDVDDEEEPEAAGDEESEQEEEVAESELDGSLAEIGDEIGGGSDDPNESSVIVKEDKSKTVVESRPPEPSKESGSRAKADTEKMEPQTIESDAIEPADNDMVADEEDEEGRGSTIPPPTETDDSPVAPNVGDEMSEPETGESTVSGTSETGRSNREASGTGETSETIPTSGERAWRGCEDPEGLLSIVPLVEAYLGS